MELANVWGDCLVWSSLFSLEEVQQNVYLHVGSWAAYADKLWLQEKQS